MAVVGTAGPERKSDGPWPSKGAGWRSRWLEMDVRARPSGYQACLWFACCQTLEGRLCNLGVPSFLYKTK